MKPAKSQNSFSVTRVSTSFYAMHTKDIVIISCDPESDIKDNSVLSLVVISMLLYIVVMLCIVVSFRYKKRSFGLSDVRWIWMLLWV